MGAGGASDPFLDLVAAEAPAADAVGDLTGVNNPDVLAGCAAKWTFH